MYINPYGDSIGDSVDIMPDADLTRQRRHAMVENEEDLDAILDGIDEILEEDTEEFVDNYPIYNGE